MRRALYSFTLGAGRRSAVALLRMLVWTCTAAVGRKRGQTNDPAVLRAFQVTELAVYRARTVRGWFGILAGFYAANRDHRYYRWHLVLSNRPFTDTTAVLHTPSDSS